MMIFHNMLKINPTEKKKKGNNTQTIEKARVLVEIRNYYISTAIN